MTVVTHSAMASTMPVPLRTPTRVAAAKTMPETATIELEWDATASATEQLVLAAVGDEERTATEVAELTGVSRATAQRRLATMASRGVVIVRLRYGQSGRPEHLYSKSGKAQW